MSRSCNPNAYQDPETWWETYSKHYEDRSWIHYRPLLSEILRYALEPPILDIGCGYGFLVEAARNFGIPAIGLEGSSTAFDVCRKRHPLADVRLWKAGSSLPFDKEFIGAVLLNEFVDHITLEENNKLVSEIYRVLKGNGILMVKSPSKYNRFDKDLGHVTFFSPKEFRGFVESFGFEVLSQPYEIQPLLGMSKVAKKLMSFISKFYRPERWSSTISLVARKKQR